MPCRLSILVTALSLLLAGTLPAHADEAAAVRALVAQGDLAAALQRAEAALAARPADPSLRFVHGVVLMDLQRDEAALAVFTALSQEYPGLPDPYNNIALLDARAGQLEPALLALETALRNDPGHRLARANLGQVHLMLAVQAWDQLAAGGPLEPALQRRLEAARALVSAGARPAR
jgi:tetratricopeptide (TPR) repeat protein